jgi:hypothetical protein
MCYVITYIGPCLQEVVQQSGGHANHVFRNSSQEILHQDL